MTSWQWSTAKPSWPGAVAWFPCPLIARGLPRLGGPPGKPLRHLPPAADSGRGEPWLSYVPPETWPAYEGAEIHSLALGERGRAGPAPHLGRSGLRRPARRLRGPVAQALPGLPTGNQPGGNSHCGKVQAVHPEPPGPDGPCACLGLTARDLAKPAPYVRILGFRDRGRQVLREGSQNLPLAHAGQRMDGPYFDLEQRCTHLYGLFSQPLEALNHGSR